MRKNAVKTMDDDEPGRPGSRRDDHPSPASRIWGSCKVCEEVQDLRATHTDSEYGERIAGCFTLDCRATNVETGTCNNRLLETTPSDMLGGVREPKRTQIAVTN